MRIDGSGDANLTVAVGAVNKKAGSGRVDHHVLSAFRAVKENIHKKPTFIFATPFALAM